MTDCILIPSNPAPHGCKLSKFSPPDGVSIRYGLFPIERARGCVVLLSGRSEFIEKYFEVIKDLHERGFSVATMDWRGQGLSSRQLPERQKGHVSDFNEFKNDLHQFIEEIVKPELRGPYILLTHSMGGLPSLMLLAEGNKTFERAVLCAPMTGFHMPPAEQAIGKTIAKIACALGRSGNTVLGVKEYSFDFEGNVLTSDEPRHTRFRDLQNASPEACISSPTYGWLNAAAKATQDLYKPGAFANLSIPVLIVSAEKELLVSNQSHEDLAAQYDLISHETIDGALHEILMEQDQYRSAFWDAFDKFIAPVFDDANHDLK